ncbi:MAG: energy transducer TonB [Acidobacteriia bacterium]|nr:energy transducer TonB [Terriglobia bacterium]
MTLFVTVARAQEVYTPGDGVSLPTVVKQAKVEYTQEALDAHIEGIVGLETVVLSDGKVGDVKVVRSLDPTYGLDQQAVKSMKLWEFKPGRKDGKPVAVRVNVNINFTLK